MTDEQIEGVDKMKLVLILIQPYYVFLIIARLMGWDIPQEKRIEVRKDYPKDSAWDREVHIYCSKNRESFRRIPKQYQPFMEKLLGKVIGEFVCDNIEMVNAKCSDMGIDLFYHDCKKYGCLSQVEVEKYFGVYNEKQIKDLRSMRGNGYAWHISDLKIYDKPKELGEFGVACHKDDCEKCGSCIHLESMCGSYPCEDSSEEWCAVGNVKSITRPPQSWCYVEEV